MSAISQVRKTLIVPVYATVLSAILVACGGVTIKDESRLTGENAKGAKSGQQETSPEVQTKGLSLTLPADMPKSVDTVQITVIQQVEAAPEPTNVGNGGFNRLPPCAAPLEGAQSRHLVGGLIGNDPCGSGIESLPWWDGFAKDYPRSAQEIGKLSKSGKKHKHHNDVAPTAKTDKKASVQPIAFIPAHWADKSIPAGCGGGRGSASGEIVNGGGLGSLLGGKDPLAAFLDEPTKDNSLEKDTGFASSSIFSYTISADTKEFSVSDLEPGSYIIVIELIDSKTGSVVEKGETTVTVEAGKISAAKVKLEAVPANKGAVAITVERAPVPAPAPAPVNATKK